MSEYRFTYRLVLLSGLLIWIAGCTSVPLREARTAFYSHQFQKAEVSLSKPEEFSNRDKLLLFMEKGLILHHVGKYEDSVKEFLNASYLIKKQDVISVSQQAASLVTTEWITEYKGEYSERLWVHSYLMMNYLLLNKYEDALVEAKQALRLMEQYPIALSDDYFTRALIALCYEILGENNDAYIEYKKLNEAIPDDTAIAEKLYRLAVKLGFHDDAKRYKGFVSKEKLQDAAAELILFAGIGNAPKKIAGNIIIPPTIRISFPQYQYQEPDMAEITVSESSQNLLPMMVVRTSVDNVCRASLSHRASKIMIKEAARAAVKETLARAVESRNHELVGALFRAVLFITEEPDTRSWETLPASLYLLRFPLVPGTHSLNITISRQDGRQIENIALPVITLSPGQKGFHSIRVTD
ncbi:MAG: hypothetical protein BWK80_56300 [Desulfobacteraceae bacterium IS3]|nr:MAG: hypothetical protein BWK80_56300 [Desulfobacteraceae bacterium IS3]